MSGHSADEIDFEQWATLASTDPEKFEKLRQDQISALINSTSGRRHQRLLGLQWKIDTVREKHKDSPIASCIAISELMWDTFNELARVLCSQTENGLSAPIPTVQANIITFPEKQSR